MALILTDKEQMEQALSMLDQCEYAVLAMADPEGNPYCIPISPVYLNDAVYFHCGLKGQKLEYIKSRPQVCLTGVAYRSTIQEKYTVDFDSFVLYGKAEMMEDYKERIAALRAISERYVPDQMGLFETVLARSLDRTGVCRITPVRFTKRRKRVKTSE